MRHAATRTRVNGAGRGAWITLAATACLVAIAACGSSSNPHTTADGGGVAQGIKFADCMRSHGVTGFPDPVSSLPSSPGRLELGIRSPRAVIAIPNTIDPRSPTFKQDAKVCKFPGA
jgi:hypothetical protein